MKMDPQIAESMIAPCGITCHVCYVHLKTKKPCAGCRAHEEDGKPEHCRQCKIKDCAAKQNVKFCFECPTYPCPVIKRLDKSYRQRYQVSLIENALRLKSVGPAQYLQEERLKWTCPACGGVISLHDQACSECGKAPQ